MALGDWLNSVFGSNASTTPASETLKKAGYQQYQQTGAAPPTGYGVTTAAGAGGAPYLGAQAGLLQQLQAQAAGAGPDPAQIALAQATQNNIAQQAGLAAGNALGNQNPGVAGANLARNAAMATQAAAGQGAMAKSQEQLAAEQALAGLTGQGINQAQVGANAFNQEGALASGQNQQNYWQGQNIAQSEQDQYNQALAALTGAQEAQRAQNGNAIAGLGGQIFGGALNAVGGAIASDENVKMSADPEDDDHRGMTDEGPVQIFTQTAGQAISPLTHFLGIDPASGGIGGRVNDILASDEKSKFGKANAEKEHEDLLEALSHSQHAYQYKDPSMAGAAPGTHFGPMAQEIEKGGPVGESLVHDGPDGVKRVDTDRMTLALASAAGALHHRVSALEEHLKMKYGKKEAHG